MHAFDRQTDGQTDRQTDGQTEISSLDRVCIACSAVKMLTIQNRRLKKQYVIGGSGILDSILQFLVRTSQAAKNLASSVGKTALDEGKTVAVEAGKKLIDKVINPKPKPSNKLENIVSKYTGNGNAVAIQDMVRKLNGSG